jgi:hypothetical protein
LLITKALILTVFMPIIGYLFLCNAMAFHYRTEVDRYCDAAEYIASGWLSGGDFSDHSRCEVDRYETAGGNAASYPPFNAWWMIRNWRTDFLAEQPACKEQPSER